MSVTTSESMAGSISVFAERADPAEADKSVA